MQKARFNWRGRFNDPLLESNYKKSGARAGSAPLRGLLAGLLCLSCITASYALINSSFNEEQAHIGLFLGLIFGALPALASISFVAQRRADRAQFLVLSDARGELEVLRDGIDSMNDGLAIYDAEGRVVLFNQKMNEIIGLANLNIKRGDFYEDIQRRVVASAPKVDEEEMATYVTGRIERRRRLERGEHRLETQRMPGGRWIHIADRRTANGGVVTVVADITNLKSAEESASRAAAIARKLLDANDSFAQLITVTGERVLFNKWVCRFFNKSPDELQRLNVLDDHKNFPNILDSRDVIEKVIATKRTVRTEFEHENRHIRYSMHPILNAAGAVELIAQHALDITPQVEEADRLRREADAANRAKSAFLANMSHELRTPLNAIIGFSELTLREPHGSLHERYSEYIGAVHKSGKHLLSLVNEVLDFSKIEAGHYELCEDEVFLDEIVTAAGQIARARANESGVTLVHRLPEQRIGLVVDQRAIKQVLINLFDNAVKFSDRGGTVMLSARIDTDALEIRVADTGKGIDQSEIDLVLQPFVQANQYGAARRDGTGLGLPISARLAELHGGSLHLESEVGKGTTAVIRLPMQRVRLPQLYLQTAANG